MPGVQKSIFDLIEEQKMGMFQWGIMLSILPTLALSAGFFISIYVTSGYIIKELNLGFFSSGVLLGITGIGHCLGVIILSQLAGLIGRKLVIVLCTALAGIISLIMAYSANVYVLILLYFLSGFCGGGIMSNCVRFIGEFSLAAKRFKWIVLVSISIQVGAIVTYLIAINMLPEHGWRLYHQTIGVLALMIVPFLLFQLSESLFFLASKKSKNSLESINKVLNLMGVESQDEIPLLNSDTSFITQFKLISEGPHMLNTMVLFIFSFMVYGVQYGFVGWLIFNFMHSTDDYIYYLLFLELGAIIGMFLIKPLLMVSRIQNLLWILPLVFICITSLWFQVESFLIGLLLCIVQGVLFRIAETLFYFRIHEFFPSDIFHMVSNIMKGIEGISFFIFTLLLGYGLSIGFSLEEELNIIINVSLISAILLIICYQIIVKIRKRNKSKT